MEAFFVRKPATDKGKQIRANGSAVFRTSFHLTENPAESAKLLRDGAFHIPSGKTDSQVRSAVALSQIKPGQDPSTCPSGTGCFVARGSRTIKNEKGKDTKIEREILLLGFTPEAARIWADSEGLTSITLLGPGVYV